MSDFILLTFNNELGIEAGRVLDILDNEEHVSDWYNMFGNTFLVKTVLSATDLAKKLRERYEGLQFIAVEFDVAESGGYLPMTLVRVLRPDAVKS